MGATGGYGAVFWLILAVGLFVLEAFTVQLICIWFAIGSLFAMLACFGRASLWLQLLIFLLSSIGVLLVGRPLLMEKIRGKKVPTNADRVVGQAGLVLQEINNLEQTGRISVDGLEWAARSEHGDIISAQEKVVVKYMDGIKLIVEPIRIAPPTPPGEQPEALIQQEEDL